jgi:hypothetical protein
MIYYARARAARRRRRRGARGGAARGGVHIIALSRAAAAVARTSSSSRRPADDDRIYHHRYSDRRCQRANAGRPPLLPYHTHMSSSFVANSENNARQAIMPAPAADFARRTNPIHYASCCRNLPAFDVPSRLVALASSQELSPPAPLPRNTNIATERDTGPRSVSDWMLTISGDPVAGCL